MVGARAGKMRRRGIAGASDMHSSVCYVAPSQQFATSYCTNDRCGEVAQLVVAVLLTTLGWLLQSCGEDNQITLLCNPEDIHGHRCGKIGHARVHCNTGRCCSEHWWCGGEEHCDAQGAGSSEYDGGCWGFDVGPENKKSKHFFADLMIHANSSGAAVSVSRGITMKVHGGTHVGGAHGDENYDNLIADEIFCDSSCELKVDLAGVPMGAYALTLYHNDAQDGTCGKCFQVVVEGSTQYIRSTNARTLAEVASTTWDLTVGSSKSVAIILTHDGSGETAGCGSCPNGCQGCDHAQGHLSLNGLVLEGNGCGAFNSESTCPSRCEWDDSESLCKLDFGDDGLNIGFVVLLVTSMTAVTCVLFCSLRNILKRRHTQQVSAENYIEQHPVLRYECVTFEKHPECSVCWKAFDASAEIRRTRCGHVFHTECLRNWFAMRITCPLCREDFTVARVQEVLPASQVVGAAENDVELLRS